MRILSSTTWFSYGYKSCSYTVHFNYGIFRTKTLQHSSKLLSSELCLFIIWNNCYDIEVFIFILNNLLSPSIKFTREMEKTLFLFWIFFLLVLTSSEGNITFDVFYKRTNTHCYLNFSSCHKSHVKSNVPYNLARRLVTIVSDPDQLEFRLNQPRQFLLEYNYPKKFINNCFKRAKTQGPRFNIKKDIIPLVVTYNPRHSIDFNLIKGLMENFESKHLQEVFKPFKIINSSRQNSNLKRLLTRADFNSLQKNVSGITHSNNERCGLCQGNYIIQGNKLCKPSSGELLFSITQAYGNFRVKLY